MRRAFAICPKTKYYEKMAKLTDKQKLFVEYYLQTWNATQAAANAGYKGNRNTLQAVGSENLTKPIIKKEISKRLEEVAMGSDEILARLGAMAKSFDVTQYATTKETFAIDKKGEAYFAGYAIDIDTKKLQEDGYSHLIKRIYASKSGSIVIEWHDQKDALVHLGKHHQLFTDKFDITSKGERIFRVTMKNDS